MGPPGWPAHAGTPELHALMVPILRSFQEGFCKSLITVVKYSRHRVERWHSREHPAYPESTSVKGADTRLADIPAMVCCTGQEAIPVSLAMGRLGPKRELGALGGAVWATPHSLGHGSRSKTLCASYAPSKVSSPAIRSKRRRASANRSART